MQTREGRAILVNDLLQAERCSGAIESSALPPLDNGEVLCNTLLVETSRANMLHLMSLLAYENL